MPLRSEITTGFTAFGRYRPGEGNAAARPAAVVVFTKSRRSMMLLWRFNAVSGAWLAMGGCRSLWCSYGATTKQRYSIGQIVPPGQLNEIGRASCRERV